MIDFYFRLCERFNLDEDKWFKVLLTLYVVVYCSIGVIVGGCIGLAMTQLLK